MRRVCGGPGDTWSPSLHAGPPCGGSYDDVDRMTICPHVSLAGGDTVGVPPNPAAVDPRWLEVPTDATPPLTLEEIAPDLLTSLRVLGDSYGPTGVAHAAELLVTEGGK